MRQVAGGSVSGFVVETTCTGATGKSVARRPFVVGGCAELFAAGLGYAGPQTVLLLGCLDGQDVVLGQGYTRFRCPREAQA